jgi:GntR family transcriptional regulator
LAPGKKKRGRPIKPADVKLGAGRRLDPDCAVPLYFQLGAALRERLLTGDWAPGSRFPTEREIGESYGVSRTVIRAAMTLLVSDGLVVMRRGAGAYVARPRREVRPLGLVRALLAPPEGMTINVKTARSERPKEGIARLLELGPRPGRVTHVTALLEIEEEPVCLLDSYSPVDAVPWLLGAVKAIDAGGDPDVPPGLVLGRAQVGVELSFYSEWGGPQLGASPGDPALIGQLIQLGRPSKRARERRLEFAHLVFPADRAHVVFELD